MKNQHSKLPRTIIRRIHRHRQFRCYEANVVLKENEDQKRNTIATAHIMVFTDATRNDREKLALEMERLANLVRHGV